MAAKRALRCKTRDEPFPVAQPGHTHVGMHSGHALGICNPKHILTTGTWGMRTNHAFRRKNTREGLTLDESVQPALLVAEKRARRILVDSGEDRSLERVRLHCAPKQHRMRVRPVLLPRMQRLAVSAGQGEQV